MSAGGKGDGARPMKITRNEFASNWDKVFQNIPLVCTTCKNEPCDCQRTDDGPGQDGEIDQEAEK